MKTVSDPLKFTILAGILLLLIFGGRSAYYRLYYYPHKRNETEQHRAEILQSYRNDSNDPGEILFVGNSIMYNFNLQKWFSNQHVKNRGIGMDKTTDILNRLDEILESKPSQIFLMMGINDLSQGRSPEQTIETYKQVVVRVQTESPQTELVIMSVLPVALRFKNALSQNIEVNDLNNLLRHLCTDRHLEYVALNDRLQDDGFLKDAYTVDGIHLNEAGYKIWVDLIRDKVGANN